MLATLPPTIEHSAAWLGMFAAGLGICGVTVRRPLRWLWRRNVSEPVGRFVDRKFDEHTRPLANELELVKFDVAEIAHEVRFNSGKSLKDETVNNGLAIAKLQTLVESRGQAIDKIQTNHEAVTRQITDLSDFLNHRIDLYDEFRAEVEDKVGIPVTVGADPKEEGDGVAS